MECWGHDFALGLFSLLSSVLPLASWVAERRGLKTWQTAPVLVHHTIDIMLVEVAAILLLSRRLLDDFGSIFSENLDKIINDLAQALSKVDVARQGSISADLNNRQAWLPEVQAKLAQHMVKGQDDAAKMMVELAKPLGVDLVTFLPFVGASVLFYVVSTLFVTKCKLTAELPWLTRWNAAVGGPLLLLGAVSRKEVRSQCNGIMKQIAFRGLLLSILLAVLLAPVDEFDTATFTTLVFQRELTRAPFVLSWLTLHILTGIVAVQEIKSHRTQKDIDRHYGTCTPARAEEGHGAAAAATRLPAGQPAGVQYHLPGTPFAGVGGQSPEQLKSQTLRV
ncbi:unnamed protein product [Effrenium voratum]|nr:unnamed protein product [Effrenium voratum]